MDKIYIEIANRVSAVMRIDKKTFPIAFSEVYQDYKYMDFAGTKSIVAGVLGARNKGRKKRKKVPGQQLYLPLEKPSERYKEDAAKCEASLIAGIPKHDL